MKKGYLILTILLHQRYQHQSDPEELLWVVLAKVWSIRLHWVPVICVERARDQRSRCSPLLECLLSFAGLPSSSSWQLIPGTVWEKERTDTTGQFSFLMCPLSNGNNTLTNTYEGRPIIEVLCFARFFLLVHCGSEQLTDVLWIQRDVWRVVFS